MKSMLTAVTLTVLIFSSGAFAQTASTTSPAGSSGVASSSQNQNTTVAQKISQDLAAAGFTDIKVVAESYVVQAKTKNGDPVLMTVGPHGMSVFEAVNANDAGSNTTGSNSGSSSSGVTSGGASHK